MTAKAEIVIEPNSLRTTQPTSQTTEHYVDAAEAAQFLSINRRTLMHMARQGNIPAHPVGDGRRHSWRFRLSELDSWMRNRVNSRCRPCSPNRREIQPYAGDQDWIFASERMKGRQPLWPEAIERNYIRPAARRAKIIKHIGWHVFRHTFSTLLAENDEDVKTVQSLMRHANSHITMNIYTHAVSSKKRRAQSKVVEMILPEEKATAVSGGVA